MADAFLVLFLIFVALSISLSFAGLGGVKKSRTFLQ